MLDVIVNGSKQLILILKKSKGLNKYKNTLKTVIYFLINQMQIKQSLTAINFYNKKGAEAP